MNNYYSVSESLSKVFYFSQKLTDQLSINKSPKNLYQPINYIINNKGKQIRSLLALLSYDMFGGTISNLKELILAIEALHNFTLIHDDVMDNAKMRRNKTSINKKWSNNQAIISGDVLLMYAYKQLLQSQILTINNVKDFTETSILICEGQQLDLDLQVKNSVTVKEYYRMIELKTSALIKFALMTPSSLTDSGKKNLDIMSDLGRDLGSLFQIQDDYLDLYGNEHKIGKMIGGDILEKKKTFLYLTACAKCNVIDRRKLTIDYASSNNENKVHSIMELYNSLGVKEIVEAEIKKLSNSILKLISMIDVSNTKKDIFSEFIHLIITRKF